MAEIIKRVLGTTVGVNGDVIELSHLDLDRNGLVERHEVKPEQWDEVLARGDAAMARRTAGLSTPFGPIRELARYAVPALQLPKTSGVPVAGMAICVAALDELFGAHGRGESLLNPLTLINKLATVAYEGTSSLIAGVAGSAAGAASSTVLTPAGGLVVGVTTAVGAKVGIDWLKNEAVYVMYEQLRTARAVHAR